MEVKKPKLRVSSLGKLSHFRNKENEAQRGLKMGKRKAKLAFKSLQSKFFKY